ncbi:hypothetical protein IscW_ISCW022936 [Ixodes scapularis]|uniref:Cortactin-binding protein-2 N-terminal domain-containing protein n=1 Tax=Ixodes scapularis TaxID=6945 RepID=B7QJ83_IXOSC|nr:hypothetical protein IscW_ISCW022936 [Ixodes scapularis]|eukprot:XP_002415240.1 hypothetical protein IscW_ISCW022936 [Ixodes scapularis]
MSHACQYTQKLKARLCRELDEERGKRVRDAAQGDDVTFLLEKEREHLRQEIDYERQQKRRLEKDLQQGGTGPSGDFSSRRDDACNDLDPNKKRNVK